jgi:hypothetical protein
MARAVYFYIYGVMETIGTHRTPRLTFLDGPLFDSSADAIQGHKCPHRLVLVCNVLTLHCF